MGVHRGERFIILAPVLQEGGGTGLFWIRGACRSLMEMGTSWPSWCLINTYQRGAFRLLPWQPLVPNKREALGLTAHKTGEGGVPCKCLNLVVGGKSCLLWVYFCCGSF